MPTPLPPSFRFGVATAGFQVEGGYNGPGEPRNNWYDWEQRGRVAQSGWALRFWDDPEPHLDRAVAAGCDTFRLSVEWARAEPGDGIHDPEALRHYRRILDLAVARGLHPVVTLHHFTHPHHLGTRFWLDPASPARFADWAARAVDALGDGCTEWITLNEPNILAYQSFVGGWFPPGGRGDVGSCVRALDHMLAAHVRGYEAIRARQPEAVIATNTYALALYELDQGLLDVLAARHHGVARPELEPWLAERRRAWYEALGPPPPGDRTLRALFGRLAAARGRVTAASLYPTFVGAVYASEHDRPLDVVQLDIYNVWLARHLRLPGHRTAGGRRVDPSRARWDDPPDPALFGRYVRAAVQPGLPVWVVENGICSRVRNGVHLPRLDGWTRTRYLTAHLAEVQRLVADGVPLGGYLHWTLADNYEWGTYEPAFGLYAVDRDRGLRWLDVDGFGEDAAGTYRSLIARLRAGTPLA